jgi:deoxyribonuclease-1-like protein
MKRSAFVWFALSLCALTVGCDVPLPVELQPETAPVTEQAANFTEQAEYVSLPANGIPGKVPDNLLVATFNIQVFGVTKAQDVWVMQRLAAIIRMFDVVAIQEIRSTDDTVLQQLVNYVNAEGEQYNYVISERLGRTVSKEQYAYVFDTTRVLSAPNATYTVGDGKTAQQGGNQVRSQDLLHREPYVARFVSTDTRNPFRFTLINIHTDPDLAESEVNVLADVYQNVKAFELSTATEDDVLLMGDFNAAPNNFGRLALVSGLLPVILDEPTNTAETKLYDNIVVDKYSTSEYTGRSGVLRMRELFGLQMADAKRLSDHNPVWAEFTFQERAAPTAMAGDPALIRR